MDDSNYPQSEQPQYQQPPHQQPYQQPPYQQPPYQQMAYQQPNYAQGRPPRRPDNYLVWAILCTILCCLPLGIVSIIYSSKVDKLYNDGDYTGAQNAANSAKNYAMWGAISSVIIWIIYFVFIVGLGILGSSGAFM